MYVSRKYCTAQLRYKREGVYVIKKQQTRHRHARGHWKLFVSFFLIAAPSSGVVAVVMSSKNALRTRLQQERGMGIYIVIPNGFLGKFALHRVLFVLNLKKMAKRY